MAVKELSVGSKLEVNPEVVRLWKMPVPRSGLVLWRHSDRSGRWGTAVITEVFERSVDVMIFPSNQHQPQPKTGVKFHQDPALATMAVPNPGGVWKFTEAEDILRRLMADVMPQELEEHEVE